MADSHHEKPRLYIFAGLPGSGKSSLASRLAEYVQAVFLRIDTIEQGLRDLCHVDVEGEGYRLAYRIAADNLRRNQSVVADSCNPITLTREEWRGVAADCQAVAVDIEVICSDREEHRHRVEGRASEVPGLVLPTWQQVVDREYHPWTESRIVVDTAGESVETSFRRLLQALDQPVPVSTDRQNSDR